VNPDVALFRLLNIDLGWDRLAPLMKTVSGLETFVPALAVLLLWMAVKDGTRGRVTLLALLVLVPLSDQLSSHLLKPWVGRPRPCRVEAGIEGVKTHGVHCSSRGSFPSSHAVNTAAPFFLLWWRYRRKGVAAVGIPLVVLIGYSRIYLGVHYPGDVAAGWGVGAILGVGIGVLTSRLAGGAKNRTVDG
jgi:undecaprenyl-diphosphatase